MNSWCGRKPKVLTFFAGYPVFSEDKSRILAGIVPDSTFDAKLIFRQS
jgi:hypothetical protein